ncbi:MAG: flagellar protein FlaG [Eubacterium sp.]|nr:flagellar protein FlaG [Eubacterium sp.]
MVSAVADIRTVSDYTERQPAEVKPAAPVGSDIKVTNEEPATPELQGATQESEKATVQYTPEEQEKKMAQLEQVLKKHDIQISYNDEVNRYAISVLDSDTKEVIKEIPSEKMVEMFENMMELKGMLVDESR